MPSCTPDGKWVFYNTLTNGRPVLMKMSIEGGTPTQPLQGYIFVPQVSPDGKWLKPMAFHEVAGKDIISLEIHQIEGDLSKSLPFSKPRTFQLSHGVAAGQPGD